MRAMERRGTVLEKGFDGVVAWRGRRTSDLHVWLDGDRDRVKTEIWMS